MTQARSITVHVSAELADLLPGYLAHRRSDLAGLELAIADGDLAFVRVVGHQLKGSGTSFGLEEVSRLGACLESAAKRDDLAAVRAAAAELRQFLGSVEVVYDAP